MTRSTLKEEERELHVKSVKEVSDRMRKLREFRNATIEETAGAIGITRPRYNQWELQKASVPLEYLKKIAEHFSVSTDYLLGVSAPEAEDILDEVIGKLLRYKSAQRAVIDSRGISTEEMVVEQLLRVAQKQVNSAASSIFLRDKEKDPYFLRVILKIGYSKEKNLTTPDIYDLEVPKDEDKGQDRPTVRVFHTGNIVVKRNVVEVTSDKTRRSSDEGCGAYAIIPLLTTDKEMLGVLKFENHVDRPSDDSLTDDEIAIVKQYSATMADFLKKNDADVALVFEKRSLAS